MTWRSYAVAAIALVVSEFSWGDTPAPEREYSVLSESGIYQFTMYPSQRDGISRLPARGEVSRVSPNGSAAPIWHVEGWYSFETFLTDDGRTLVRMGPWASLPVDQELAVAFYREGTELSRYVVADLIQDPGSIVRSVSHYQWQADDESYPRLSTNGSFEIRTIEGRTISFDPATGAMLQPDRAANAGSATAQVTREDADNTFFAMNLFRENGIDIDAEQINRVVRGPDQTIVWMEPRVAGLPVYFHPTGYSFDRNRRVIRVPETDEPLLYSDGPLRTEAFPIDHRPDIDPAAAIDLWLTAARRDSFLGADYRPTSDPEARLGFFDIQLGTGRDSVYRLVWRVAPAGGRYPVAMVGAKKGDLLFFDSGVRTVAGPLAADRAEADSPDAAGSWIGEPCGGRSFTRRLMLESDGTFTVTDRGQVKYEGSWRSPRPNQVLLQSDASDARRAASLPRNLAFDASRSLLHEATPGAGEICSYEREGD